jgi:hypothetical protein
VPEFRRDYIFSNETDFLAVQAIALSRACNFAYLNSDAARAFIPDGE